MVGILPQYHGVHRLWRGQFQRAQWLRRKNARTIREALV
jgi:hypothetical protein